MAYFYRNAAGEVTQQPCVASGKFVFMATGGAEASGNNTILLSINQSISQQLFGRHQPSYHWQID